MGGGDLNLKKSWHPGLHVNREAVWKQEQAALDERKRLHQLRKERAEERQVQELQRLSGKREERVEWMYAAPATGSGPNNEELEAYLLGKKRVDQLFKEQDEKKMAALKASTGGVEQNGAAANQYQALGSTAHNARDMANKVRNDPLLAIRQQELASLEAMRKNKAVQREARAKAEEREAKRREKEARHLEREAKRARKAERRARQDRGDASPRERRSYSPDDDRPRRRSRSPDDRRRHVDRPRSRSRSPVRRDYPSSTHDSYRDREYRAGPMRFDRPLPARTVAPMEPTQSAEERLASMQAAAAEHQAKRAERMAEHAVEDQADQAREDEARRQFALNAAGKGLGADQPEFLKAERAKYLSQDLATHLRAAR